uniref:Matrix extracellular phosphoglycoprotein n=1 Tax=Vombatus ursinus TaxID=29139 RepID=A0A4X2LUP8_VOMUR
MSWRKKWQTTPQKEGNKDRVPVHHFGKGNKQEISSKGNVIQESDKSQNISAGKQMLIKDQGTGSSKTSHHDFEDTIYTGFTGNAKAGRGDSVNKDLPDQEAHRVILVNKNVQHGRKYASAPRLWVVEEDGEENKIGNSVYMYPEAQGKRDEDIVNKQRDVRNQNIPGDHRAISLIQYTKTLSPKHIKFTFDFEGSGQGKEGNDLSPSSGEMVVPDTKTTDDHTSVPDPDKAKLLIGKEGNNQVPEKEEYDLNSNGGSSTGDIVRTDVSKTPRKEKNIIDNQIGRGSNVIRGSTNYKELPGNKGESFDAKTGDSYQEIVGIHPSQGSLKKQSIIDQHARKGSNNIIKGKDISKHGKDNTEVGVESSKRDQKTKTDKEKNFNKGKSQGLLIPSHGHTYPLKGENEIKNEVNLHNGYNRERSITKFPDNSPYAAQRKFSSTRSHHGSGRKRFWGPINVHSHKKFKPHRRNDSSDSSSSDSSDNSDQLFD